MKNRMFRLTALLLALLLCTACAGKTVPEASSVPTQEPSVYTEAEPSETEAPPTTEQPTQTEAPSESETPTQETEPSVDKDRYQTDPVPDGRPAPVEPGTATEGSAASCTFSISCATILNNWDKCDEEKKPLVPSDGVIFPRSTVTFSEGESVFDVLQRVCRENKIHMESSWTPIYNSAYVEGINNLYEFDVGSLSGWMYSVNGWFPNYGCSRYELHDGDVVEWVYTCDLGKDVGGGYSAAD